MDDQKNLQRQLTRGKTFHTLTLGSPRRFPCGCKGRCDHEDSVTDGEFKDVPLDDTETTAPRRQISLHEFEYDVTGDLVPALKRFGYQDLKEAVQTGYNRDDTKEKLEKYGPNELPKPELDSYFSLWIGQFKDIMMILLLVAMGVSYAVGDPIAATAIAVILMVATNIGAYTEWSSNRDAAKLGGGDQGTVTCRIGGRNVNNVQVTSLFPGMIVVFPEGESRVPADCRIIHLLSGVVSADEGLLTGESLPVQKRPIARAKSGLRFDEDKAREDRERQVIINKGTILTGSCYAIVVATGVKTKMGDIFQRIADVEPEPSPLQDMIEKLIKLLALLSIAASVVNMAVCAPTGHGTEPNSDEPQALECGLGSVALTVAAVPENLPVALIIALASIIKKLSRRRVIVKNLVAGENLGKVTMILTDKTGTLTQNRMTAVAVIQEDQKVERAFVSLQDGFIGPDGDHEVEAKDQDIQILHIAGLQTDQIKPNQTDKACQKAMPEEDFPMMLEHFETFHSKKKMSKGIFRMKDEDSKNSVAVIKGAPDYVMRRCNLEGTTLFDVTSVDQRMGAVTDLDRESWTQRFSAWSSEGLRLIAIAVKPTDREFDVGDQESEGDFAEGFVFLGVIAIQDPPRVDVKDHIAVIKGAGVKVHVVTGDFPQTARNIAEQVGILRKPTREELEEGRFLVNATDLFRHKDDAECLQIIEQLFRYSEETGLALIIGRMKPAHKQLFVKAAKLRGEVVAMTGDGSNDAPALRDAHIGVAVGGEDSSELAQAAADMILLDGSFKGIVVAIREGRLGFENILKFLLYLLGTNISEVFFYLSLTFVNIVIALDALNLLVLNLLTDGFPAIALAVENAEGDLMKRNPLRRDTTMLNKFTYVSITVTNVALLVSYYVVYLLGLEWHTGDVTGLETDLVADYDEGLAMARMMIVLVINISQLLLAISHRVPDRSIFSIGVFSGKWMNISAFSSIGLIILMTHTPGIMEIMRTEYLDARSYILVVVMSVLPVIVHELTKVLWFEKLDFNIYKLYEHRVKHVQVLQGVVVERPHVDQKDMEMNSLSEPKLPGHIVVQQTEAV